MCFNQRSNISTLNVNSLKLVHKLNYLGSSVSSTETDINTRLAMPWTAIDRLLVLWKSDLTDKMKRCFFQAMFLSILMYGCTTWTLTKCIEKKNWRQLHKNSASNIKQDLRAALYKAADVRPPTIVQKKKKTLKGRRTRHWGHCWRSRDEFLSEILLWTPSHGRPARTYIQQLCADTGCRQEDQPEAMDD